MKDTLYGAAVTGCSGVDVHYCSSRGCADRVRRVTREYVRAGYFSGARTISALAQLAADRRYGRTGTIIAEFLRIGRGAANAVE